MPAYDDADHLLNGRVALLTMVVHGARGRMGARITDLAERDERFANVIHVDRQDADDSVPSCDVIVDFSTPEGSLRAARIARARKAALLVGTTGLSAENVQLVEDCARSAPVMIAPNTSLGIAVLCHLVAEAARLLPDRFDIDVVDRHHARKRDAPSGTALRLAAVMGARGGREVDPARVHAIRAGDTPGDHEISFAGDDQLIRIAHSAGSRDVFARGAIDAAAWLSHQPPGSWTIEDCLGLGPRRGGEPH